MQTYRAGECGQELVVYIPLRTVPSPIALVSTYCLISAVFNVNVHLSRYTPTGLKANMSISTPFTSKCWSSSSSSLFRIFKVKIFRDGNKANIEIFASFLWRAWVDWQQEPLRPHLLPPPIHRPALLRQVSEKTANNQTTNNKQTSKKKTGKASNNLLIV